MIRSEAMKAGKAERIRLDDHDLRIARPDKVLFPEDAITKRDLIRYYQEVGPWMLPHLEGRPLTIERFPDGIQGPGFFQKAAAPYYPAWIRKATVPKAGGTVRQVVCDSLATLVYLANQAGITAHTWLSRIDKPQFPDQMIFDLDPSVENVAAVITAARALKEVLAELELPAYVKATGSRGLHVAVPLDRTGDFDSVRAFARKLAEVVVGGDPARYTLAQRKNKRDGRLFLDVNRNAYAQTAVTPYAVRARPGAPVSLPLHWRDLDKEDFRPDGVTMRSILEHPERFRDPWKDFWRDARPLEKAGRKLHAL